MPAFDVIVLGCGAMGSSALWHLTRRGIRCCGIEQYSIPHDRGSSHGDSRAIRKAYFEHPDYIPLLNRAYDLWTELEAEAGLPLKHDVGMVFAGAPEGAAIRGLERTYAEHRLPHDRWTAEEASRRYPQFTFHPQHTVFMDPLGGYVEPEASIRACVRLAERDGAAVLRETRVRGWRASHDSVSVKTDDAEYSAGALIVTAGAWSETLTRELRLPLQVLRKVLTWYAVTEGTPFASGFPVWFVDMPYGAVYGFPARDGAIKVAMHSGGNPVPGPDALDRQFLPDDDAVVLRCLRETFPWFEPRRTRHAVCMYTMTPDENFILDRHPEYANVAIAAGFSGHGFKFMPVVGEILADLAQHGETSQPIAFLRLTRF